MKKLIAVMAAVMLCGVALAQEDTEAPTRPESPVPPEALSKFTTTWNVYTSQWLDAPRGITVKPVSLGTALYANFKVPLYRQNVTLMLGPGIAYTDFRINGTPVNPIDTNGNTITDTTFFVQLQPQEYIKNKMSLVHVELPVELQIAFNKKSGGKGFYIAPGFLGGVLVNDYMKRVWEDEHGDKRKVKDYYTRNLSKFHYGASVRVGYGWIGLNGYYSLSPLFEEGKGPGTTFYRVGLTFGGI